MQSKALTFNLYKDRHGLYQEELEVIDKHLSHTSSMLNQHLISLAATKHLFKKEQGAIYLLCMEQFDDYQ